MSNASFTRDEVILALDVLYFSGEEHPNAQTTSMKELSALLNRLPIHEKGGRDEKFRNPTGVARQILLFRGSKRTGKKDPNVGVRFFEVDAEFEDRRDELHSIAMAIRRNEDAFDLFGFGTDLEALGFPEGSLLGHLHRLIEVRDSEKIIKQGRCEICQIDTDDIYPECSNILMMHLTVPITALDVKKKYGAANFITVCPNCHAALHRRRPWLTKENCGELLH